MQDPGNRVVLNHRHLISAARNEKTNRCSRQIFKTICVVSTWKTSTMEVTLENIFINVINLTLFSRDNWRVSDYPTEPSISTMWSKRIKMEPYWRGRTWIHFVCTHRKEQGRISIVAKNFDLCTHWAIKTDQHANVLTIDRSDRSELKVWPVWHTAYSRPSMCEMLTEAHNVHRNSDLRNTKYFPRLKLVWIRMSPGSNSFESTNRSKRRKKNSLSSKRLLGMSHRVLMEIAPILGIWCSISIPSSICKLHISYRWIGIMSGCEKERPAMHASSTFRANEIGR